MFISQNFLIITLGPVELLVILYVPDVVIDGWNVNDLLPNHLGECGVINIYRVLKRVSSCSDSIASSLGSVTVNGNAFPHRMRCLDCGLHLFERKGLVCFDFVKTAGQPEHLD